MKLHVARPAIGWPEGENEAGLPEHFQLPDAAGAAEVVTMSASGVLRTLLCVVLALAVVGGIANGLRYFVLAGSDPRWLNLVARLDLDHDPSLAAWWSSLQMSLAAGLLLLTAVAGQRRLRDRACWFGLAILFVVLSIDESIMIHEMATVTLRNALRTSGPLHFAWVVPGMGLVVLVGGLLVPFLLRLDRRTRTLFVLSAVLFLGGALGMEMLDGLTSSTIGAATPEHLAVIVAEETLEMLGISLFVFSLLDHLRRTCGNLRVRVAA